MPLLEIHNLEVHFPIHPRCPVAEARGKTEVPPLRELDPGRQAACHLAK